MRRPVRFASHCAGSGAHATLQRHERARSGPRRLTRRRRRPGPGQPSPGTQPTCGARITRTPCRRGDAACEATGDAGCVPGPPVCTYKVYVHPDDPAMVSTIDLPSVEVNMCQYVTSCWVPPQATLHVVFLVVLRSSHGGNACDRSRSRRGSQPGSNPQRRCRRSRSHGCWGRSRGHPNRVRGSTGFSVCAQCVGRRVRPSAPMARQVPQERAQVVSRSRGKMGRRSR